MPADQGGGTATAPRAGGAHFWDTWRRSENVEDHRTKLVDQNTEQLKQLNDNLYTLLTIPGGGLGGGAGAGLGAPYGSGVGPGTGPGANSNSPTAPGTPPGQGPATAPGQGPAPPGSPQERINETFDQLAQGEPGTPQRRISESFDALKTPQQNINDRFPGGAASPAAVAGAVGAPGTPGGDEISDVSATTGAGLVSPGMMTPTGLLVHHTGGGETRPEQVVNALKSRKDVSPGGASVQFTIGRDGRIYKLMPDGSIAYHAGRLENLPGLGNKNLEGVEVMARNEKDVTPAQRAAVNRLYEARKKRWGWDESKGKPIYGHGEGTSRKERDEGATAKAVREGKITTALPATAPAAPAPAPGSTPSAANSESGGALIVFRGKDGQLDEASVKRIAAAKGLTPVIFTAGQEKEAIAFAKAHGGRKEVLGFSAGADTLRRFLQHAPPGTVSGATSVGQYSTARVPTPVIPGARTFVDPSGQRLAGEPGVTYFPGRHMPGAGDPGVMSKAADVFEREAAESAAAAAARNTLDASLGTEAANPQAAIAKLKIIMKNTPPGTRTETSESKGMLKDNVQVDRQTNVAPKEKEAEPAD